jgi:hypothetical protein
MLLSFFVSLLRRLAMPKNAFAVQSEIERLTG